MNSNIIRDIVAWVECHLEDPLPLDDIAEKSGYSKWHLQRAFKERTQITLGTYVRYRRLSRVAIELRLTNNSMIDIAAKYCFDSPQSFSRAFKRRFKMSPGVYRRQKKWIVHGILPALYLEGDIPPSPEYIQLSLTSGLNSFNLLSLPCSKIRASPCDFSPLNFY
ncbi:MAG: helix-turn-helix domain-containing protein [Rouxiella badensis]|uniref:helix-turn-helix domain-containing protein n=1 Tax=Rouxiella badensis TaxID=1646377 RepID=UPI003C4EF957